MQGYHTVFQPAFIATEEVFFSCLILSMFLNVFMCPFQFASFIKNVDVKMFTLRKVTVAVDVPH